METKASFIETPEGTSAAAAPELAMTVDAMGMIRSVVTDGERALGFSAEELMGRSISTLFGNSTPIEVLFACADSGKAEGLTARLYSVEGAERYVQLSLRAFIGAAGGRELLVLARETGEGSRSLSADERLVEAVLSAREEERARIAQELHDALGQQLTAIAVQLRASELLAGPALEARLRTLRGLAENALTEVSRLAHQLRPPSLELGLAEAIKSLVDEHRETFDTAVSFKVLGEVGVIDLPAATELSLYRIVQEALTNVAKHANARHLMVTLDFEARSVRLRVQDDGRGFPTDPGADSPARARGLGLAGIRERARFLGGRARFESSPGLGTTVDVMIPLSEQRE